MKLASGEDSPNGGESTMSCRYSSSLFIRMAGSTTTETVLSDCVESRSFLQCFAAFDVSQGCNTVAFRDGKCCRIAVTAADAGWKFTPSDGSGDDMKVMLYKTPTAQVGLLIIFR